MKYNIGYFDVLRRLTLLSRCKNRIGCSHRAGFTTLSENQTNYYDILDKRNLTDSSGFEKDDHRRSWTNRDDSTTEDHIERYDQIKSSQRLVTTYRNCKVTKLRSKVSVSISAMDGDDIVSGICYNMFGVESDMSLENLYKYLQKRDFNKSGSFNGSNYSKYSNNYNDSKHTSGLSAQKGNLLDDFKTQIENLIYQRKLSMDQSVKILLVYDRMDSLSHGLRNLIQSHMFLNLHRFTPFQVVATFEIFGKHRERYESFLNLLCLIFYDHMMPLMRSQESLSGRVGLENVLEFLRVLKDFSFKKLTDVLYAHVYDNIESMSVDNMVQVSNTFFKNKKDPNFVELYTKMLSIIFKMPALDLNNFENYAQRRLNISANDAHTHRSEDIGANSSNILLDDIKNLEAIFNCNSEFLLSSVHHRIEFKRLWRHNIKTNNVNWKLLFSSNENIYDHKKLENKEGNKLLSNFEQNSSSQGNNLHRRDDVVTDNNVESVVTKNGVDNGFAKTDINGISGVGSTSASSGPRYRVSYIDNFQNLYEKIEHVILNKFKFQNCSRDFVCNLIATVLDYSRYSTSSMQNTHNILTNLYSLLLNLRGNTENIVNELKLISPKTLLDHSHIYFYKIDDNNEFYKYKQVNYHKPHLITYSLVRGDHRPYSLLMKVYTRYMSELRESISKNDHLTVCKLIENVLHPFYCSMRASEKPFLALDMIHMSGNLSNRCIGDFSQFTAEYTHNIEKCLSNGLLSDLLCFTEQSLKTILKMVNQDLRINERVQVLKAISTINICNKEFKENSSEVQEYTSSAVDDLMGYFKSDDKEDLEDGVRVGEDLKLFNYITDLLVLDSCGKVYELLRELLKTVYHRMDYYNIEELTVLSNCISASLSHFSKLNLEENEAIESTNQTLRILKKETVEAFYLKTKGEDDFNPETIGIYNMLMMYHTF